MPSLQIYISLISATSIPVVINPKIIPNGATAVFTPIHKVYLEIGDFLLIQTGEKVKKAPIVSPYKTLKTTNKKKFNDTVTPTHDKILMNKLI